MPSFDDIRDQIASGNRQLWLLIAVAAATLVTLQAIESALSTSWPHQGRPASTPLAARRAQPVWGAVGLLVLLGALLALSTLLVMLWRDLAATTGQTVGGLLLAIAWPVFMLVSWNKIGMRALIQDSGLIGPLSMVVLLVGADLLLLVALLDILPAWGDISEAITDLLPI
jgi:hypothetical protein